MANNSNLIARGGSGAVTDPVYYNNPSLYGNYQYITLKEIIGNFTAVYVGANKVFENLLDGDINYHAHRALQELSYDTLKSCKSQEIILPSSLQMPLPADYINYTKITYSDANGIECIIYPTSKTSNPNTIQQDADGNYLFSNMGTGTGRRSLLQDNNRKPMAHDNRIGDGYRLDNNTDFGWEYDQNIGWLMKGNYSGPFRLRETFKRLNDTTTGSDPMPNVLNEPYLTNGMAVSSFMFQHGTVLENVTNVIENTYSWGNTYYTEFYLSKPTVAASINNHPNPSKSVPAMLYMEIDDRDNTTVGKYKASTSNSVSVDQSTTTNLSVDADNYFLNTGQRYGLEPQYAQANGSFYIDKHKGIIHFSSNLNGKTIILHYLSDHHGHGSEAIVHKFAEEAMYNWIAYGCAQARTDVPESIIQRFKREKSVETRKAKIRLSNIKIEEISQTMRGKAKFIDH